MSGRQTEAAARGLELIAQGVPVRKAAEQVGLHPGTLSRAKKRAGMPEGKAGRPKVWGLGIGLEPGEAAALELLATRLTARDIEAFIKRAGAEPAQATAMMSGLVKLRQALANTASNG